MDGLNGGGCCIFREAHHGNALVSLGIFFFWCFWLYDPMWLAQGVVGASVAMVLMDESFE